MRDDRNLVAEDQTQPHSDSKKKEVSTPPKGAKTYKQILDDYINRKKTKRVKSTKLSKGSRKSLIENYPNFMKHTNVSARKNKSQKSHFIEKKKSKENRKKSQKS